MIETGRRLQVLREAQVGIQQRDTAAERGAARIGVRAAALLRLGVDVRVEDRRIERVADRRVAAGERREAGETRVLIGVAEPDVRGLAREETDAAADLVGLVVED